MTSKKISELPEFESKELLLQAQTIGVKATGGLLLDGTPVTLIGLAEILVKEFPQLRKYVEAK